MQNLPLPYASQKYIIQANREAAQRLRREFPVEFIRTPKTVLERFSAKLGVKAPQYTQARYVYVLDGEETFVNRVTVKGGNGLLQGHGDDLSEDKAQHIAAMHAVLQLVKGYLIDHEGRPTPAARQPTLPLAPPAQHSTAYAAPLALNGNTAEPEKVSIAHAQPTAGASTVQRAEPPLTIGIAREFIDWYCKRFGFGRPDLSYKSKPRSQTTQWNAILAVSKRSVGLGEGPTKRLATERSYIDAADWLAKCDKSLWQAYQDSVQKAKAAEDKRQLIAKTFPKADFTPALQMKFTDALDERLRDIVWELRSSELYKKAKLLIADQEEKVKEVRKTRAEARAAAQEAGAEPESEVALATFASGSTYARDVSDKSSELRTRLLDYRDNPRHQRMRTTRESLPVYRHAKAFLQAVEDNPVVILMAQTGSGKTTQIPSILLDDWIEKGKGGKCNVVCTQPRRIAAISVAQRVAAERGEQLGDSVGYQVRFENQLPKPDGSILFCTTGIFLKRFHLRSAAEAGNQAFAEDLTHVIVDEVHERDMDVDLLCFILRLRLNELRRAGKPGFKIILMSATIDPALWIEYFRDPLTQLPAPTLDIPGRTFPVKRHYLNDIVSLFKTGNLPFSRGGWVFSEKDVNSYLQRELQAIPPEAAARTDDPLKLPSSLIGLVIAHIAVQTRQSRDGHILVFLPGLDEIKAVQRVLLDTKQSLLDVDFENYEIHILHSAVPVAEQQAVFSPTSQGVQRIILSTNIAETSVTIPNVVYVVDAGKCKEKRYDPERHMSMLVSAFTGVGNMNQRAGRAGRHREGEYYSLISRERLAVLPQNQTVEMKRLDLSNVVMHIKGLDLPMDADQVLEQVIEPPEKQRVTAAIKSLEMVGALDSNQMTTSLGRVLLKLPVDAAIGKLCLFGCFFRCLDQAVTIAALLTNRDPFVSPLDKRAEANMARQRFAPPGFTSDILTSLKAFNQWATIEDWRAQRDFCDINFLSHSSLQTVQSIKDHVLQRLAFAGALQISGGEEEIVMQRNSEGRPVIPPALNVNGESLPLLTSLIAAATAPNLAIRKSQSLLRTPADSAAMIHPSSLLSPKKKNSNSSSTSTANEVYAFSEATKTSQPLDRPNSKDTGKQASFLRGVTLLDPLGMLLFGVHKMRVFRDGFKCDDWLPVTGNVGLLDDLERFKDGLHLSLLRVFEGLNTRMSANEENTDPDEDGQGDNDLQPAGHNRALAVEELRNLDALSKNVVEILNMHAQDNGMPFTAPIARRLTSRDEPDPYARPFRQTSMQPTRRASIGRRRSVHGSSPDYLNNVGNDSAVDESGWGSWGAQASSSKLHSTDFSDRVDSLSHSRSRRLSSSPGNFHPTSVQRPTSPAATNGWTPSRTHTSLASNGADAAANGWEGWGESQTAPVTRAASPVKTADGDEWAAYTPSTTRNDAYERRAALTGSGDTGPPAAMQQPVARVEVPRPVEKVAAPVNGSDAVAPAEDDGWGAWQASTTVNDAYEKRAKLSGREEVASRPVQAEPYVLDQQSARVAPGAQNPNGDVKGWGSLPTQAPVRPAAGESDQKISNGASEPAKPAEDDGWGSWQASTQVNDAFERRSRLRPGESLAPASQSHVTTLQSMTNGHAPNHADASGWGQRATSSPYPSTPHKSADLLSRLTVTSPAPSSARRSVLPELERQTRSISIKGRFDRLKEETNLREAKGEKSRQLEDMRKRVQTVDALKARGSVAPSESGRGSPAPSMISMRSVAASDLKMHAPQPVRHAQVQGWSGASDVSAAGSVGWE